MNIYDQYLSLLQMFFHHQDNKAEPQEKKPASMPVSEKEIFREVA